MSTTLTTSTVWHQIYTGFAIPSIPSTSSAIPLKILKASICSSSVVKLRTANSPFLLEFLVGQRPAGRMLRHCMGHTYLVSLIIILTKWGSYISLSRCASSSCPLLPLSHIHPMLYTSHKFGNTIYSIMDIITTLRHVGGKESLTVQKVAVSIVPYTLVEVGTQ